MTLRIIVLEKLCLSQAATTGAARGALSLMERGFTRYPASWDRPAIAAVAGEVCHGVLSLSVDTDDMTATVHLAWCDPATPTALARMLIALRRWCREKSLVAVYFTHHEGNADMAGIGKALGAQPHSRTYRIDLPAQPLKEAA